MSTDPKNPCSGCYGQICETCPVNTEKKPMTDNDIIEVKGAKCPFCGHELLAEGLDGYHWCGNTKCEWYEAGLSENRSISFRIVEAGGMVVVVASTPQENSAYENAVVTWKARAEKAEAALAAYTTGEPSEEQMEAARVAYESTEGPVTLRALRTIARAVLSCGRPEG